ncbi:MAG: DNA gyrase subunit A [Chloroflexi bacterium]|nr:MAG: DNA gyrase subunit A [Chloroflexota bacterium]
MTTRNTVTPAAVHTNGSNGAAPANIGDVRPADIVGEMQVAYLDYAMSVIVARALPDVRDGLKPVHRRILYAMYADLGLTFDKPHKKSARIVGEVLGKYHPHGDVAVYDAMARMAQNFSLRYPLVDGQGNFGSIDGDSPAAMRYTEARLAEISNLVIEDLEKDTVSWNPNFDNSLEEPSVLPAALPNLLINGANGIAVGMATNIPPHNLGEVVDALAYLIDHYKEVDEVTVEQLLQFIKGPDFPTGGIVYRYRVDGKSEEEIDAITQGYSVGKSRLVMQAKAHFEEMSRGRSRIVITELPYQTNKSTLIERIADLVRDGKLEGITDLRDESDRTGMRVLIELSRTAEPKRVLADLFKYTPLQQTFGMQLLALVDGQPRTLSLKRMLHLFVQHREEIVRRRSEFDLRRARERAHIVEGLLKALDIIDEVIRTIRSSQRVDTARANLVKNFGFSEVQAQAILDMQLRRLAALERSKLKDEYKELKDRIAYLEDLLAHPEKILALIKEELLAIKEKHSDARRTQIVDSTKGTLTTTDLLPDQTVWVTVNGKGELRRQEVGKVTNTALRQAGRGADVAVVTANTREPIYLFSADGRCTRVPVHEIPSEGAGKHVSELSRFNRGDTLAAALVLPEPVPDPAQGGYLFLATEQGVVKRIAQADLLNTGGGAPTVIAVAAKDRLVAAFATTGNQEVILVSAQGQAIRFNEEEVRSMGLSAAGVGGMKLKKGDRIVYAAAVTPGAELTTVTANGFGKRSALADYPSQGRNGGGIVTHKVSDRTGPISAALLLTAGEPHETLVAVTRKGVPKLISLADLPLMGRSVQGRPVVETTANDVVVSIQRLTAESQPALSAPAGPSEPGASIPGEDAVTLAEARPSGPGANGGAPPPRQRLTKPKTGVAVPTKPARAANQSKVTKATKTPSTPRGSKQNGREIAESKQARAKQPRAQSPSRRAGADASTRKAATATRKSVASEVPAPQPAAAKRTRRQAAALEAKTSKKTARAAQTIQPELLAVEEISAPPPTNPRAKKVQAVVSVPSGQARKKATGTK